MKIFTIIFSVFLFLGCATPGIERVQKTFPTLKEERTAGIGDIFFESMETNTSRGIFGENLGVVGRFSYDLTILEANEQKIGLHYSEYTNGFIREGFNKRLDYPASDKFVRFKDFEFDIISVGKGLIRYKRIK